MRNKLSLAGLVLLVIPLFANQAVPSHAPQTNGLPRGYTENPYQYRYGQVTKIEFVPMNGSLNTRMKFSPVGTFMLFPDEIFTFCGNQGDMLGFGPSNLVVLIFSRRMHRLQCYELLRIDVIDKHHNSGQSNGPAFR